MSMIDTFFNMLRKVMVLTVFVIFGFAATYIPQPHINNVETAHAQFAVWDSGNFIPNWGGFIESTIQTVYQAWLYLKENVLDGIAWTIAKQIISNMTASLVDWINSGFEGSPAFVQDLNGFLLQAADEVVGRYINELGGLGSFVCEPFRLDVQLAVAIQYDLDRTDDEPVCTLTDVIDNFEGFIDGTSRTNTWDDWLRLTSEPQNTPYGAVLKAKAGSRFRVINAKGEELEKTGWGGGFLSGELCNTATGAEGEQEDCFITKPGKMLQEALTFNLDSGRQSLIEADEFDEVLTSLLTQLANQAITGASGLLGLSGGTGESYTGYSRGSFTADLADGVINESGSGGGTNIDIDSNPAESSARDYLDQGRTSQQTVLNSIDTYIQDLTNYVNNPLNDDLQVASAQQSLSSAITLRGRAATGLNQAEQLIATYNALEAEYPTATLERRTGIRNEQTALVQQYGALNLVSTQEYNAYTSSWDAILATNSGQTNFTNCSPAEIRTGQCNTGPGITP